MLFGGGSGIGDPPMPNSLELFGGGNGIGDPPMPSKVADFGGGSGMGDPPMPAILCRSETLPITNSTAKANANATFFTAFLPVVSMRLMLLVGKPMLSKTRSQ
jgi:hypothetical protein